MLFSVLTFLGGLVVLTLGADVLVRGASTLALRFGISSLVVGLTIVAFGTSAPEMAVSVGAALEGSPDLAVGNVVGSNIANVLLILGLSALIAPLLVARQVIRQEIPVMIGASLLFCTMALDGSVSRLDAAVLFALVVVYTVFLVRQSRAENRAKNQEEAGAVAAQPGDWKAHWATQVVLVLAGLAMLVVGADWLVKAATDIARALGASELLIGLTIVAVGTSMPEIATSLMAVWRGERDIAVGNVVGSNVFNLLAVLGAAGVVSSSGLPVPPEALRFDVWVMLAVACSCLPLALSGSRIDRKEGAAFLAYYALYLAWLVLSAQHSPWLPGLSVLMTTVVLPLTVVVVVFAFVRSQIEGKDPPSENKENLLSLDD